MSEPIKTMHTELRMEKEISIMEIATALGEEKKLLFGLPAALCVLTAIVSLLMTPMYTAETVLMPPQQQQSTASALLDQLGPLAGAAMGAAGLKNPSDLYAAILKSNAVRDKLIERFNLKERYKVKRLSDARAELDSLLKITSDRTGLISIEATDADPKFSAELANAHIEVLQEVMGKLSLSDAQQRRRFFEQQVDKLSDRPFRDVRVQETILASMMRQYEMAQIDEAREGPLFQQIEVASPPDRRSSPKRTLMVVFAGFAGLFLGMVLAVSRYAIRRAMKDSDTASQWKNIAGAWALSKKR